ncbi:hypothetical protein LXA26_18435, partial [Erwinia amylovora]|uniref:hypothetical protein n=1 Tax=Erwinia amylovora TaxID=552 RepID=UPI0020BE923E
ATVETSMTNRSHTGSPCPNNNPPLIILSPSQTPLARALNTKSRIKIDFISLDKIKNTNNNTKEKIQQIIECKPLKQRVSPE